VQAAKVSTHSKFPFLKLIELVCGLISSPKEDVGLLEKAQVFADFSILKEGETASSNSKS
jgi:hypothetical protein